MRCHHVLPNDGNGERVDEVEINSKGLREDDIGLDDEAAAGVRKTNRRADLIIRRNGAETFSDVSSGDNNESPPGARLEGRHLGDTRRHEERLSP